MRTKAAMTWAESEQLLENGRASGAASRAYYAVYQAVVAGLDAAGKRPGHLTRPDPRNPDKWPHDTVVGNCQLVGLDQAEKASFELAKGLRIEADYKTTEVEVRTLRSLHPRLRGILEGLGVIAPRKG